MKWLVTYTILAFAGCVVQPTVVVSVAQDQRQRVATEKVGQAEATKPGIADGEMSPALTGARRPLYRLSKSDVLGISFTFAPEFDQTVSVQPDGFITLKGLEELYAEGMTLPALREQIRGAYAIMLHDPEVTLVLKEFDKPSFIATGQVAHPGKYELRGDTTLTEAVGIGGGFTQKGKHAPSAVFLGVFGQGVQAPRVD